MFLPQIKENPSNNGINNIFFSHKTRNLGKGGYYFWFSNSVRLGPMFEGWFGLSHILTKKRHHRMQIVLYEKATSDNFSPPYSLTY